MNVDTGAFQALTAQLAELTEQVSQLAAKQFNAEMFFQAGGYATGDQHPRGDARPRGAGIPPGSPPAVAPARGQGRRIMSPRGRHATRVSHPSDEPWARTSDRSVWRAYKFGLTLTVTHLVGARGWVAEVEGPGVSERSDVLDTRLQAQHWADDQAGGAS